MIYFTQLIFIKDGKESSFHEFENIAIPAIAKYNGKLLLRIRPDEGAFIEANMEKPYEIHLIEFNSEEDFKNFQKDEDRLKYLHLKEKSIKSSILIQGQVLS